MNRAAHLPRLGVVAENRERGDRIERELLRAGRNDEDREGEADGQQAAGSERCGGVRGESRGGFPPASSKSARCQLHAAYGLLPAISTASGAQSTRCA